MCIIVCDLPVYVCVSGVYVLTLIKMKHLADWRECAIRARSSWMGSLCQNTDLWFSMLDLVVKVVAAVWRNDKIVILSDMSFFKCTLSMCFNIFHNILMFICELFYTMSFLGHRYFADMLFFRNLTTPIDSYYIRLKIPSVHSKDSVTVCTTSF